MKVSYDKVPQRVVNAESRYAGALAFEGILFGAVYGFRNLQITGIK